MQLSQEFWGVEVKAGESVKVVLNEDSMIHMSQAALGDSKGKGKKGFIPLRVKIEDKKFILGSLSEENISHVIFNLVFRTEFELSHDSKDASVFFLGYKVEINDESDDEDTETFMKLLASSNWVEPKSDNKPNLVVKKAVVKDSSDSNSKEETTKEVNLDVIRREIRGEMMNLQKLSHETQLLNQLLKLAKTALNKSKVKARKFQAKYKKGGKCLNKSKVKAQKFQAKYKKGGK